LVAFVVSLLLLIPAFRELTVGLIGVVFDQRDPTTGELNEFSTAMRGFAVVGGAVVVFIGSGWLLLWTDVGKRLAFLLTGAGTFGWLVINGILFVVYAPRGIRPENLEGLNAIQVRLPAIAMTAGSLVLLLMFLTALSRYEADEG
jgi:peptidoglycan/LPS O-acetylase OafA/YrhL